MIFLCTHFITFHKNSNNNDYNNDDDDDDDAFGDVQPPHQRYLKDTFLILNVVFYLQDNMLNK